MSSLRYAINLIVSRKLLVIFPEGKINKSGKKIPIKQGLFRLAKLANKKGAPVNIVPIGIAYEGVDPKFRDKVALFIEKPIKIDDFSDLTIEDFNEQLWNKIYNAELKAKNLIGI